MNLYKFLEKPKIYNFFEKILSLGNKSCKKCLLELIKSKDTDLLLDVGCGTGKYAESLPGEYYGIDVNKDYIDYAKKNYKGNFSVMDATDLRFSDNKFNSVFIISILHHMSDEDVVAALSEMERVCKKNGRIVIVEAVYPSKLNFIGYVLFKLDRGKYTRTMGCLRNLLEKKSFNLLYDNIRGSFPYKFGVFIYQKL
ncbi:MAG: class I SAM-dependent methyltransferase [Patescibacteria group bacterium]